MGERILILLIVLAVVTLVGHGIWALVAAVFRALTGESRTHRWEQSIRCPGCGQNNPVTRSRCDWCGIVLKGELADLAALRRIGPHGEGRNAGPRNGGKRSRPGGSVREAVLRASSGREARCSVLRR